ncbi:MAG TPA: FmdE family protein [Anaerolineae bacterium]|nr:FmdE family protein [Anaerolineae bacterium]
MKRLADLLEASAALHRHLCPRQVLGVRIGLAGAAALQLDVSRKDKRLLVIRDHQRARGPARWRDPVPRLRGRGLL